MAKYKTIMTRLSTEVLSRPGAAALPSRLSNYWLDCALKGAEQLVHADHLTPSDLMNVTLSLVVHLTLSTSGSDEVEIQDEELFLYLKQYRWELAMEKLRRWGINLTPQATEETMFTSHVA